MNKKLLGIAVVLMAVAMLAVPVLAKTDPKETKVNKVAVTLTVSNKVVIDDVYEWVSGGVTHTFIINQWDVTLEIEGGPTYTGTAMEERKYVAVTQKDEVDRITRLYYEISFPSEGGGFEGNAQLIIDGFTGPPPPLWDETKIHYLLKGTGAFEGQTLNVGKTWTPFGGPLGASGYLLKP